MEVFFILFVVFAFYYVLGKDPPPKPKSPGDKLMEGLEAAAKQLGIGNSGGGGGSSGSKKSEGVPWQVLVLAVAIGLLLTYL